MQDTQWTNGISRAPRLSKIPLEILLGNMDAPPGNGVLISLCTAIQNRLPQFSRVFDANRDIVRDRRGVEWIVLDYGSTDDLHEFMGEKRLGSSGRIRYVQVPGRVPWHASVAKNAAHARGRGKILMNLDCDNFIHDAIDVIRAEFSPGVGALHLWSGVSLDGTFGRIAIDREVFNAIGGYDEALLPMAYQDVDLLERVTASGHEVRCCRCPPHSAIRNSKNDAVVNCGMPGLAWQDMMRANRIRSLKNIQQGKLVANLGANPRSREGKLSFCTASTNRRCDLEQTLRENLETTKRIGNSEIVLVNYDGSDELDEWVRREFRSCIDSGVLRYVLCSERERFHIGKAKNVAHLSSTGEWLFNLDADQVIGAMHEPIRAAFAYDAEVVIRLGDRKRHGTEGRIGLSKESFLKLGGYDEDLLPHGYEDSDLLRRAEFCGMPVLQFSDSAIESIRQDDNYRTVDLPLEVARCSSEEMRNMNKEISRRNLTLGRWRANPVRRKVRTIVNWDQEVYV